MSMLFEENLFASNATASNADLMLHEAPKLENNDLLLEHLDFNLTEPTVAFKSFDSDIIKSVFSNPSDPLIPHADSAAIDEELKEIFGFVPEVKPTARASAPAVAPTPAPTATVASVPSVPIKEEVLEDNIFKNIELEARSHSTAADFVSIPALELKPAFYSSPSDYSDSSASPNSKRSYSTADLGSNSPSSSGKDKLGCTPYTRKQRNMPLPPVVPKGEDLASMKRARNTEAARRSRARKMERMSQLEEKCEGLLQENDSLKKQVETLKALLAERGC